MKNTLTKSLAVLLIPVVAILSAYLLGFLRDYLITLRGVLALHDNYYLVPSLGPYLISLYILGFLPAVLLQKFTGRLLAAATPSAAITLYHLIKTHLDGFSSFVSVSSVLAYYPLAWFLALLIGLTLWNLTLSKVER